MRILIPCQNYVLFKQIKKGESEGGVALPESAQQTVGFKVLDLGPDVKNIKKGDYISFKVNAPIAVTDIDTEKDIFLIKEEEIIARIQTI